MKGNIKMQAEWFGERVTVLGKNDQCSLVRRSDGEVIIVLNKRITRHTVNPRSEKIHTKTDYNV
jgi:uncharacterized protein YgiM (DUF1202 family)